MTRQISRMMTLVACAGLIAGATGCSVVAITGYPPQHQPMTPGSRGTDLCGAHSGWLLYPYPSSNKKYTPDSGTTKCVLQVVAGDALLKNTQYNIMWRASALDRGCAAPVAGSTTQKSFRSYDTKQYNFTLYFTPGNCPPTKTDVQLLINFH
jgi:hypothetical protein